MAGKQTGVQGLPGEPFVVSFRAAGADDSSGPDVRASAHGLRARVDAMVVAHRERGWSTYDQRALLRFVGDRSRTWTFDDGIVDERRWTESLEQFPDEVDLIKLTSQRSVIEIVRRGYEVGNESRSLIANVTAPAAGVDEAAAVLLDQLVESMAVPEFQTGFVHVDTIADPYSAVVTQESELKGDGLDFEVYGYYWAVALKTGHLERLGGVARVRREAPCARIETIEGPGHGLVCVLTESPLDMSVETVVAWRNYLQPVLRPGYAAGWEDIGARHTPLARPIWLFEGVPAPRFCRTYFQGKRPLSDPTTFAVEWADVVDDPEAPTCWLYPGKAFDPDIHFDVVAAAVRAWAMTGRAGQLYGTNGSLGPVTEVSWDTDDDYRRAMVWRFQLGDADHTEAIGRLAMLLDTLCRVDPFSAAEPPFLRLLVA